MVHVWQKKTNWDFQVQLAQCGCQSCRVRSTFEVTGPLKKKAGILDDILLAGMKILPVANA